MPAQRRIREDDSHQRPYAEPQQMDDDEILPFIPIEGIVGEIMTADEGDEGDEGAPQTEPANFPANFPALTPDDHITPKYQPKVNIRRIMVPPHRFTPLKKNWVELITPLVKHMKLQVRMNTKRKCVELRMDKGCPDISHLSKGADYVRAFMLGFELIDAVALLRLDDLFLESFEIKDVKRLVGDNFTRCIGRISGKDGKVKHAIENSTRTRLVIADRYIHILGAFTNIRLARHSICSLILGSPPGKVYNRLRNISKRLKERR